MYWQSEMNSSNSRNISKKNIDTQSIRLLKLCSYQTCSFAKIRDAIKKGGTIGYTNEDGANAFMMACRNDYKNVVRYFLKFENKNRWIDDIDIHGQNAMHYALYSATKEFPSEIVDILIKNKACKNLFHMKDKLGNTPCDSCPNIPQKQALVCQQIRYAKKRDKYRRNYDSNYSTYDSTSTDYSNYSKFGTFTNKMTNDGQQQTKKNSKNIYMRNIEKNANHYGNNNDNYFENNNNANHWRRNDSNSYNNGYNNGNRNQENGRYWGPRPKSNRKKRYNNYQSKKWKAGRRKAEILPHTPSSIEPATDTKYTSSEVSSALSFLELPVTQQQEYNNPPRITACITNTKGSTYNLKDERYMECMENVKRITNSNSVSGELYTPAIDDVKQESCDRSRDDALYEAFESEYKLQTTGVQFGNYFENENKIESTVSQFQSCNIGDTNKITDEKQICMSTNDNIVQTTDVSTVIKITAADEEKHSVDDENEVKYSVLDEILNNYELIGNDGPIYIYENEPSLGNVVRNYHTLVEEHNVHSITVQSDYNLRYTVKYEDDEGNDNSDSDSSCSKKSDSCGIKYENNGLAIPLPEYSPDAVLNDCELQQPKNFLQVNDAVVSELDLTPLSMYDGNRSGDDFTSVGSGELLSSAGVSNNEMYVKYDRSGSNVFSESFSAEKEINELRKNLQFLKEFLPLFLNNKILKQYSEYLEYILFKDLMIVNWELLGKIGRDDLYFMVKGDESALSYIFQTLRDLIVKHDQVRNSGINENTNVRNINQRKSESTKHEN